MLSCQVRKKKYSAFKAHMAATKAPNILNRDFHAEAPDRKWVTDVTEFNIQGKKISFYLCSLTSLTVRSALIPLIIDPLSSSYKI